MGAIMIKKATRPNKACILMFFREYMFLAHEHVYIVSHCLRVDGEVGVSTATASRANQRNLLAILDPRLLPRLQAREY